MLFIFKKVAKCWDKSGEWYWGKEWRIANRRGKIVIVFLELAFIIWIIFE
jgi:hypothetical protein